jgi:HlyD family secretion protein
VIDTLQRFRPSGRTLVLGAFGLLVGFIGVRSLAPPLWAPGPGDARAAERELRPPPGGEERRPVPAGDLVAGEGIVEPADRETKVAAAVAGRIAEVRVKEGDQVEAGAVLLVLDNATERAALEAAEGDLAVAQAQVKRTANGERPESVEAAAGDAESARARARLSREALARTERLAKGGAATAEELERAQRQAEIDGRAFEAAEARRRALADGARPDDLAIDRARLQAAVARRDQARATLERTFVRTPLHGQVLQLKVRAGEYASPDPAAPLAVVGDTRKLRVRMDVDERDVGRVQVGQQAFVQASAFGDRRFTARVVEVGRRMGRKNLRSDDPTERIDTKILEAVCELDPAEGLVPGLRVIAYVERAR